MTLATTIGTLAGSTGKVLDLLKSARDRSRKDPKTAAELDEARDLILSLRQTILDLQDRVLSLQEELGGLKAENIELKEQLREQQAGDLERAQYERRRMGQSVVMVRKTEPETPICPTCFENKKVSYLSPLPAAARSFFSHICPTCEATFQLR